MKLSSATLSELDVLLDKKVISASELTDYYLARIERYNPAVNAFIRTTMETAHSSAQQSDMRRRTGRKLSPLDGIPMAHKDIFCTQGITTTASSKMLENFIPSYDATIVRKLAEAGAVMTGKLAMDEFAMGASSEHNASGVVRNPWHRDHVPGGSSGGSAVAVATRLIPYATGSDTGGSIRQPAAYCGITGIKPTYGTCSRWGMIAFASSLDQAGPIAVTAEDCALILNAMAGFDNRDSTSSMQAVTQFDTILNAPLNDVVIGLPTIYFDQLDPRVTDTIFAAAKIYEKLGARLVDVTLENTDIAVATYYIIACAEASSNLARYDGVRYGYQCKDPKNIEDLYRRSRTEALGKEVQRRIMIGAYVLSAGYYDAYYEQARRGRRAIFNSFREVFTHCNVILGPTTPSTAFKIGSQIDDPVAMFLSDLYTVSANLAGLPALSHPAGFIDDLPIGCQLIGPHFSEPQLLNLAHRFQQESDYHHRIPSAFVD